MDRLNPYSGNTFGADLKNMQEQLLTARDVETLDKIQTKLLQIQGQVKTLHLEGSSLITEMWDKTKKFVKWTGMTLLITKVRMYVRKLFTTVYELDTALIDLRKTFKGTNAELEDFYNESSKIAKQMGVTTKEIIQQGAAWSRLGYNSNDAVKKMAQASSMFAAISPDMNVEQAQNGLVSIMKAFNIAPDNVTDEILSKVNIIGNTAATSNGEIVEMLEKSSAAMKEANNTLEQTIALETAAVEITRDSSSVGNAFKTVSMRLRGYDEEVEAYVNDVEELSGKIADVTKTVNNPGGISLFTDANKTTYKSTYQILKDISEIYDDLTDKQQASLLELLAGKRQGQIVAATLSNFDAVEEALLNMQNSAGSAEAEMETIRESAEYSMNRLKVAFEELAKTTVSRKGLKSLIDFGADALEFLTGIVEKLGLIPTLLTAIVGVMSAKKVTGRGLFGLAANEKTGKTGLTFMGTQVSGTWLSDYKTAKQNSAALIENKDALQALLQQKQKGVIIEQDYNRLINNSNASVRDMASGIVRGTVAQEDFNTQMSAAGSQTKKLSVGARMAAVGVGILNAAVSMGISLLVSFLIGSVVKAFNSAIHYTENLTNDLKELNDQYKSLSTELKDINDKLVDTHKKMSELEKLPELSLLKQEELEALQKYNDELERQQTLRTSELEANRAEARKKANDLNDELSKTTKDNMTDFVFAYGKSWKDILSGEGDWQDWVGGLTGLVVPTAIAGANKISNFFNHNSIAQQTNDIEKYKKAVEELEEIRNSESYRKSDKKAFEREKEKQDEIDKLTKYISSAYDTWNEIYEGTKDSTVQEDIKLANKYKELMDQWDVLIKKPRTNISEVFSAGEFASVMGRLQELWRKGKLTAENFDNAIEADIKGIEKFKEALEEIGVTDADEVVKSLIDYFKELPNAVDNSNTSLKDFSTTVSTLSDKLDDFISKQEKVADSFKQIASGAKMTAKEVYEILKEMPELYEYIDYKNGGFALDPKGLEEVSKKEIESIKNEIQTTINKSNDGVADLKQLVELANKLNQESAKNPDTLAEYDKLYQKIKPILENYNILETEALKSGLWTAGSANGDSTGEAILSLIEQIQSEIDGYKMLQDVTEQIFNKRDIALEGIKEGYENAEKEISEFNANIKTIDNAIKSLNDGELLDYDTKNTLVDILPDLQGMFDEKEDHKYYIRVEELEKLRKQSYNTRNDYISDRIAELQSDVETARETKKLYEEKLAYFDQYAEWYAKAQSGFDSKKAGQAEIDALAAQIEAISDNIKRLQELKSNITINNDSSSISDVLQDQIDYFKTIIDAIQAVQDKYAEATQKEIDALEESKDALKETNDERQRELDLIEARNNLENAKKRKVWVYTEDGGFKQVADEGAVKEAEEKLRDVVTDIQEAAIDKQIEQKKVQLDAINDANKDLLELEKNAENAAKIAEALKSLGLTDEKELANLPEDIRNEIKQGFLDASVKKENEDNKDNKKYTPLTLEDVLKSMGATATAEQAKEIFAPTKKEYDSMMRTFVNELKEQSQKAVSNVTTNNNGVVYSPTYNIYDADDPEKIKKVVDEHINTMLIQYNNSIK